MQNNLQRWWWLLAGLVAFNLGMTLLYTSAGNCALAIAYLVGMAGLHKKAWNGQSPLQPFRTSALSKKGNSTGSEQE